jgi:hypothetical protein
MPTGKNFYTAFTSVNFPQAEGPEAHSRRPPWHAVQTQMRQNGILIDEAD